MKQLIVLLLLALLCAAPAAAQDAADVLTVIAHDSFAYSEEVIETFEQATGITVEVLRLGDAGTMLNQAILSKANPLGDVLYGVDNTFLGRALAADLFIPYESPAVEAIPEQFVLDEEHRVTPINYGDVCLNYDVEFFDERGLDVPESLADLTDPAYEDMLVVENPATSSPGLAFLLATIGVFGAEGDYTYLDYWRDLMDNEVLVVDDWTTAYYGEFSGSAESQGTYPLVVSYASSPPAEVFFATEEIAQAPTGAVVADETCFRQIEFAGILEGTDNLPAAQQFIDFLLSREFQEDVPLQMFVFPVNPEAELPEVFAEYAAVPDNPILMDYEDIDANREDWIEAWTEVVLR